MASHLQDPSHGDVVIVLNEQPDRSQDRRIYACKHILAAASEFFACRILLRLNVCWLTKLGFKPVWTTKTILQSDNSSISMQPGFNDNSTAKTTDSRLVVYFDIADDDIDFVTLHILIYWMYTNSVNLRDRGLCLFPANDTALVSGHPAEADGFDLYRNAKKLLLEPLQDYCFDYLKRTTYSFNIIRRLFRPDAVLQHHDLLREWYLEKLIAEYDDIKNTDEWRRIMCNELDVSAETRQYHEMLLFEISKRLTPSPLKRPRSAEGES
jgi:hypothetical protein